MLPASDVRSINPNVFFSEHSANYSHPELGTYCSTLCTEEIAGKQSEQNLEQCNHEINEIPVLLCTFYPLSNQSISPWKKSSCVLITVCLQTLSAKCLGLSTWYPVAVYSIKSVANIEKAHITHIQVWDRQALGGGPTVRQTKPWPTMPTWVSTLLQQTLALAAVVGSLCGCRAVGTRPYSA